MILWWTSVLIIINWKCLCCTRCLAVWENDVWGALLCLAGYHNIKERRNRKNLAKCFSKTKSCQIGCGNTLQIIFRNKIWLDSRPHITRKNRRCIPHICHFFTRAKFLENKIYTEKTRKLRQNTQKIANFFALLRQNTQ